MPLGIAIRSAKGAKQALVKIITISGLGQQRKSSVGLGMSVVGGEAEVDFGRLEVRS